MKCQNLFSGKNEKKYYKMSSAELAQRMFKVDYCIKSSVINSRALTGEKTCINKAIHALLMHGYGTFSMLVPGPQNCCRHEMCTAPERA